MQVYEIKRFFCIFILEANFNILNVNICFLMKCYCMDFANNELTGNAAVPNHLNDKILNNVLDAHGLSKWLMSYMQF